MVDGQEKTIAKNWIFLLTKLIYILYKISVICIYKLNTRSVRKR